ncbi:MAG: hypothetical protein JST93_35025 [Acidobacteria bacterium]|nr:hypothetical protein [Acidobacteriota bacterium]
MSIKTPTGEPLTQTEFGRLLGKSLNTIQRYETLVAPKGRALAELAALASRHGRKELELLFTGALNEELGHPHLQEGVEATERVFQRTKVMFDYVLKLDIPAESRRVLEAMRDETEEDLRRVRASKFALDNVTPVLSEEESK